MLGRKVESYMGRQCSAQLQRPPQMLRISKGTKNSIAAQRSGWNAEPTYCKQDEVLLVVLADTVIDPGTMVVHLANAPLTNTARAHKSDL
jgi:hypothetical protein